MKKTLLPLIISFLLGLLFGPAPLYAAHETVHTEPSHAVQPEHGHGHGPVIENWWSWKNREETPPFGFALINFAIFLIILHQTAGKQLRLFLRNRHEEMRTKMEEAQREKNLAQASLVAYKTQLTELPTKRQELFAQMQKEAQAEEQRLRDLTKRQVERLQKDANLTILQVTKNAIFQLKQASAEAAVDLAKNLIRRSIKPADEQKLMHTPLVQLERAAQKGEFGAVSQGGQI